MKRINLTEMDLMEYTTNNSNREDLIMAMNFDMPYIAERTIASATSEEKLLMTAEFLAQYDGQQVVGFLRNLVSSYDVSRGTVMGVSMINFANYLNNAEAVKFLSMCSPLQIGSEKEAEKLANFFTSLKNGNKEDDMLNFFFREVSRVTGKEKIK